MILTLPSHYAVAGRSLREVFAGTGSTSGDRRFTLPEAPNMGRFAQLQRGALQAAILEGRERTKEMSADVGVSGSPPFGLNRRFASTIEARLEWWRRAAVDVKQYARSTQKSATMWIEPDWGKIQADLRGFMGQLAVSMYAAFDAHLGAQALAALGAWPHDTGLSKALLHVEISPGTGTTLMRGSLIAGAGYSGYIRERGYRVRTVTFTTKKGLVKTKRERYEVPLASGKMPLPGWKAAYLVKGVDGRWRFDAAAYLAGKPERPPVKRPAKGKPYFDLLQTPAPATAAAIGEATVAGAVKGG